MFTLKHKKGLITRDTEIKNNLTVTRGKVGGDNGGEGERVFRNSYIGHMDKTKGWWKQGREVAKPGVRGSGLGINIENCT